MCSFSSCSQNFLKANCLRLYRKLITSSTNAKGLLRSKKFEGNSKRWYLHPKSLHHDKKNIRSLNKTTYKIVLNWSQGWKNTLFALTCWITSLVGFIHKWSISELFLSLVQNYSYEKAPSSRIRDISFDTAYFVTRIWVDGTLNQSGEGS